jgi:hypothetical protein
MRYVKTFTSKRGWTVIALLLTVAAIWHILSPKPSGQVSVRFVGYAFETPNLSLDSFSSSGRAKSATRGARVAKFFVTNHCDFPVYCGLSARYTNGFGSFSLQHLSLEPHGVAHISGLAGPPRPSRVMQLDPRAKLPSLPADSNPSNTDWTNFWRLTLASRSALPLGGLAEKRYRAAHWLSQRKLYRLSQYLNPAKIQETETDLIPPDMP